MPVRTCELESLSCVLVGSFNPAIVHPAWLARHGLVRDAEADDATVVVIEPAVAVFTVGPYSLEVTRERFKVDVPDAGQSSPLLDLVAGVFRVLAETPIKHFGINRHMHFRMQSVDEWHRVGHRLAPKEIYSGLLESPGTQSLVIWGTRAGSRAARVQMQIEPSVRVSPGVYVGTNAHFEAIGEETTNDRVVLLQEEWEGTQRFAREAAEEILVRASKEAAG